MTALTRRMQRPSFNAAVDAATAACLVWALGLVVFPLAGHAQEEKIVHRMDIREVERTPQYRLGERLFLDTRLSNPGSQFLSSCSSCHLLPSRPQGKRAYADTQARSLVPATSRGAKLTTLRNTPTLYDVTRMDRLNLDGQYESLESLIGAKLSGIHMGWLPGEEGRALDDVYALLLNDAGEDEIAEGAYIEQFKAALGVDLEALSRDAAIVQAIKALVAYLDQTATHFTAPYDAFAYLNRLNTSVDIETGDNPDAFAGRLFGRLANQEGRLLVKFPSAYNEQAYQGYKIFMRTYDLDYVDRIGNCVSCHLPPYFTDNSFHNTGTAQEEYDSLHGEGSFAKLDIPDAATAQRPSGRFRARPVKDKPGEVDLGYWNFVDLKNSPLRNEGESDDEFLARTIGAFKTPGLRNLDYTDPYMHNGRFKSLEEAVAFKVRIGRLAKEGKLRNPDPQYLRMNLSEADIEPLVAFLKTLNEVGTEDFRKLVLADVVIRGALTKGSFPGTLDSSN